MPEVDHDERFKAAVALTRAGRTHEAIEALEALLALSEAEPRDHAATSKYLGDIHLHLLGDPVRAEPYYRRTLALFPRSERASLGLFHALCGQGRADDALEEAHRLVALRPSESYAQLLAEILEGAGAPDDPSDDP